MSSNVKPSSVSGGGLKVSFNDRDDWGAGYVGDLTLATNASTSLQNWTLEFDLAAEITDVWSASIVSHVGTHYVLQGVWYDTNVAPGTSITPGFVASGDGSVAPVNIVVDGVALGSTTTPPSDPITTVPAPTPPPTPAPAPAPTPTPAPAPTPVVPSISVADVSAQVTASEDFVAAGAGFLLPAGYLHTSGSQVLDASGHAVMINAINWFGMETGTFAPHGLWAVNYKDTMAQMASQGFNTIRIPFSDQAFAAGSVPNGIDFSLNPDLKGLTALQILDKIVAEASALGLKVILDHHSSSAGGGPNSNGLWYDDTYGPAAFTANWVSLASHFAGNPTVIGVDLANEPHGVASWGDGHVATDWQAAATATGDAIQAVNPNLLIVVEGVQNYGGVSTAWGENLMGVAAHPVQLNVANQLVYSVHDYPYSVTGNSYFLLPSYPTNLAAIWNQDWGYVQQQNIAPVWIGEFGTALTTASDKTWLNTLVQYIDGNAAAGTGGAAIAQPSYSWAYWDWNPNSADTGGILMDDWKTVNQDKIAAIQPVLWKPAADGTSDASFTLTLSSATTSDVTVHVQTVDATATAGHDYTALSEDVVIHAGSTQAQVLVHLLDPSDASASSVFFLRLSHPTGATIASTTDASADIIDVPTTPPTTTTPPATTTPMTTLPVTTPPVTTSPVTAPPITTTPPATTTPPVTTPPVTTPPAATPPGPRYGPGVVSVDISNDWGAGQVAAVNVGNSGSAQISGWQVELETSEIITNLWNGKILSHVGTIYEIGNADWNGTISGGGTTSFGFQATHVIAGETVTAKLTAFS